MKGLPVNELDMFGDPMLLYTRQCTKHSYWLWPFWMDTTAHQLCVLRLWTIFNLIQSLYMPSNNSKDYTPGCRKKRWRRFFVGSIKNMQLVYDLKASIYTLQNKDSVSHPSLNNRQWGTKSNDSPMQLKNKKFSPVSSSFFPPTSPRCWQNQITTPFGGCVCVNP